MASRSIRVLAVRISHAFYTFLTGIVASTGVTTAISIGGATRSSRRSRRRGESAVVIRSTESVSGLASSPLGNRAVALNKTFNAAATFEVASGCASIGTIRILGTEVYADTGEGVAVRVLLGGARGTVLRYGTS